MEPTPEDFQPYQQAYLASLAERLSRETQRRSDLPKTGLDPEIDETPPDKE